ncbi:hypothetical protein PV327_006980 [Microctonus hyperodae]|uniref:Uncharacterized protein n=1 Tax=Microctonus hyperodae TaxID=165561 RepID=A0AA39F5E9_MICHY|nr:hypothetical protein PV327_006980 [Microctonus hyperodae]
MSIAASTISINQINKDCDKFEELVNSSSNKRTYENIRPCLSANWKKVLSQRYFQHKKKSNNRSAKKLLFQRYFRELQRNNTSAQVQVQ